MYPMELRRMSELTPVTKAAMVIDSGSMSRPTFTCRRPALNHVNHCSFTIRLLGARWKSATKTITVATKLRATSAVAIQPETGLPRRFPKSASNANPASGQAGIRNAAWIIEGSALQHVRVVGCGAWFASKDGDDDAEADDDLRCRNYEDEEDGDLSADVVQLTGEGYEGQVRGVQHQLDTHEHHQDIPPDEQADRADGEDHRGEREIPGGGDAHRIDASSSALASASRSAASSVASLLPISTSTFSCPSWRRAS